MKLLSIFAFVIVSSFSFGAFAQVRGSDRDPHGNDKDSNVTVKGEVEFEVGDTKVKIGGNTYNGRNHEALEDRVRHLERAVEILFERQGFRGSAHRSEWECTIETTFDGMFIARGDTEASARVAVVQKCIEKAGEFYCKADKAKCSEVK